MFAYTITITNTGSVRRAADQPALDHHRRQQPGAGSARAWAWSASSRLQPGESFEYTSGSAIATPVGTMRGSYQMVAEDGTQFDAPIPEFTLSMPRVLH